MDLLTLGKRNPKTAKSEKLGYLTAILHLAPYKLSGRNVCPHATKGCAAACLNTAGRGGIYKKGETTNAIQICRIARTDLFFDDSTAFFLQLVKEIGAHVRRASRHGLIPAVRLNGTSDLPWERIKLDDGRTIFDTFPKVQFYDYTKVPGRSNLPANYHLTFSQGESNGGNVEGAIAAGMNVAVVFAGALPEFYRGLPVVSGDDSDLRFLDPAGVIVGLTAKGKAKKDTTGFVVQS